MKPGGVKHMSKSKFTLTTILGIVCGTFILGVLQWLGLDISLALANIWHKILGEPNGISIIIVSLITILLCYFPIRSNYKEYVKSK